jgi:type IV fimbrial biogenesis protein FimT
MPGMQTRGFTLTELLAALSVAAVLLGLALPAFQNLLAAQHGAAALNQLLGAVASARAEAILKRRTVTMCPADGNRCLGRKQWHQGALLFVDLNRNGQLDGQEKIATALPPLRPGARIYWRSFRNRSYLQFHPRGYTRWQNGNFLYCSADQRDDRAHLAVINPQGRVRVARDTDGDGVVEDVQGDPVHCPP